MLPARTVNNVKHCHFLTSSRQVKRIDRRAWEARISERLHLYESHRYNRANALHNALSQAQSLLKLAQQREQQLKITSHELQQTGNYLQTLLDAMTDILVATDIQGVITEANMAAERLLGYPRTSLIGTDFASWFQEQELANTGIQQILSAGMVSNQELTLQAADEQQLAIMYNGTVLTDLEGTTTGILITARDITDLKQARLALEQHAKELARANADLEEFAQVASHDLEEPLKKIATYASNIAERYAETLAPEARTDLDYLVDQTQHMQQLIRCVLDYSKVESGQMVTERIITDQLLDQVLANLQLAIEESGVVITRNPLPEIAGNPTQFARVFQNLIVNAVKYRDLGKKKHRLLITAGSLDKTTLALPEHVDYSGWIFSIIDNGIGIAKEFQEEIFNMFVRLHKPEEYSGAGMGLAIVWKIIRRHEGHIWVESEPGKGSAFHFTLR